MKRSKSSQFRAKLWVSLQRRYLIFIKFEVIFWFTGINAINIHKKQLERHYQYKNYGKSYGTEARLRSEAEKGECIIYAHFDNRNNIFRKCRPKSEARIPTLFFKRTFGSKILEVRKVLILLQHICSILLLFRPERARSLRRLNDTLMVRLSIALLRLG